jgi:hypothetical protein
LKEKIMADITRIVEHIRTSSGARFAIYNNDEDRRQQLIQYWNEVHADGELDEFDDDAELCDVEEAIEDFEDVSTEEISFDVETQAIDIVAPVFRDAEDAPTSFEPEEWLEGFEDGRQMVAERIAQTLKDAGLVDYEQFMAACGVDTEAVLLDKAEQRASTQGDDLQDCQEGLTGGNA